MKIFFLIAFASVLVTTGCKKDSDFLNNDPTSILTSDQIYGSVGTATSVLADLYNQYADLQTTNNWTTFAQFDEAFPSESDQYNANVQQSDYPATSWSLWNYGYVRNINVFIQQCGLSVALGASDKAQLIAEARFLQVSIYFEMAKRMGGVPLILQPMTYNFSGDVTYLQHARAKESDIYDYVIATLDTLKTILPKTATTQDRATRGVCLAMQARAALYAGSIAQYGVNTPSVSLPGGEVGIQASKANAYYQKALAAAQELISDNTYSLYVKKINNSLSDNFASVFYDKTSNPEVIYAQNFKLKSGSVSGWTLNNQPFATAEEAQGGRLNPSLNLALQYEMLNNTYAPFNTNTGSDYTYYSDSTAIFAGRDARLAGTFVLPGSLFKGNVDIWAGYILANGSIVTGSTYAATATLPGQQYPQQVVGRSGPIDGVDFTAQTGFYVRKFLDPTIGSGQIGTQSEVWWVRYRYAEVLLNAAEAAFALGQNGIAAGYMNQVRVRAGLTTPLAAGDITFDRIVHERRVELAFEGHELFDNKRWRIADKVWDGTQITSGATLATNAGKAVAPNTQIWGMWPYKIYNPGNANNGKWVYKIVKPSKVTGAHRFNLGNYYSAIDPGVLSDNPLLVKNPNQ